MAKEKNSGEERRSKYREAQLIPSIENEENGNEKKINHYLLGIPTDEYFLQLIDEQCATHKEKRVRLQYYMDYYDSFLDQWSLTRASARADRKIPSDSPFISELGEALRSVGRYKKNLYKAFKFETKLYKSEIEHKEFVPGNETLIFKKEYGKWKIDIGGQGLRFIESDDFGFRYLNKIFKWFTISPIDLRDLSNDTIDENKVTNDLKREWKGRRLDTQEPFSEETRKNLFASNERFKRMKGKETDPNIKEVIDKLIQDNNEKLRLDDHRRKVLNGQILSGNHHRDQNNTKKAIDRVKLYLLKDNPEIYKYVSETISYDKKLHAWKYSPEASDVFINHFDLD